jgi:hypothetical protein
MSLCQRTGIEGFYVAVHGTIEDLNEPQVFFSEKAGNFIRNILNLEPRHLALKLEAWSTSGLGGIGLTKSTSNYS